MNIQEFVERMAEHIGGSASVRTVYGEPVVAGERTVIPVAKIRFGFGAGRGKGEGGMDAGGGGGGRMVATPCGAIEITPSGTRFIGFDNRRRLGAAVAIGLLLGAALASLTTTRRIEVVKR